MGAKPAKLTICLQSSVPISSIKVGIVAARHNPILETVAQRLKKHGKAHKLGINAITHRRVTIENAIMTSGVLWRQKSGRVNPVARN